MGMLYVNSSGRGVNLGDERDVEFDINKLAEYMPTREEIQASSFRPYVPDISDELLATQDNWSLLTKFSALDYRFSYEWSRGIPEWDEEDDATRVLANVMHLCFEKRYGYPYNSFTSLTDYEGNVMLYFDVVWPPRITDQTLSEMTMSKLATQMDEFLSDVVIEDEPVRYDLEICEEYQKE